MNCQQTIYVLVLPWAVTKRAFILLALCIIARFEKAKYNVLVHLQRT
jgi:hypothetical protein